MLLGDLVGEALEGLARAAGRILVEFLLELLVKGPGYGIARLVWPRVDPDGLLAVGVGVAFWVVIGCCAYWGWQHLAPLTS